VRDHDDGVAIGDEIFVRAEAAAERGPDAEELEEVR
jgi:hypothetical protein